MYLITTWRLKLIGDKTDRTPTVFAILQRRTVQAWSSFIQFDQLNNTFFRPFKFAVFVCQQLRSFCFSHEGKARMVEVFTETDCMLLTACYF